jgi:chemotaxis signal transduction protein
LNFFVGIFAQMGVVYSRGQEIPVVDLSQFFFLRAKKIHPNKLPATNEKVNRRTELCCCLFSQHNPSHP